jgi:hypothetical protein
MKGFKLVNDKEVIEPEDVNTPMDKPTITRQQNDKSYTNSPQTITQAAAANFGKILELAGNVIEIKKMKVVSDAVLAKMEADRKNLLAEAEVYVEKKNADTQSIVDKMNVIRFMMQDFYQQSNQQIKGEDFRQIITSIVDQMGRIDNV